MNLQLLATSTLALLGPYLAKAGESIAEKMGDAVFKQAEAVYNLIRDKFKGDKTAEQTLTRVKQEPDQQTWNNTLLGILMMKLEEDPLFAAKLKQLVTEGDKPSKGENISQTMTISGTTGSVYQIGKMKGNISEKDS